MLRFQKTYFFLAIGIFLLEVIIANYWNDSFIRPVLGDFLVVILIYCSLRTFLNIAPIPLALGVLAFAFSVEALQYFRFADYIGWKNTALRRMTLGSTFDWRDLVAYTLGISLVILVEQSRKPA